MKISKRLEMSFASPRKPRRAISSSRAVLESMAAAIAVVDDKSTPTTKLRRRATFDGNILCHKLFEFNSEDEFEDDVSSQASFPLQSLIEQKWKADQDFFGRVVSPCSQRGRSNKNPPNTGERRKRTSDDSMPGLISFSSFATASNNSIAANLQNCESQEHPNSPMAVDTTDESISSLESSVLHADVSSTSINILEPVARMPEEGERQEMRWNISELSNDSTPCYHRRKTSLDDSFMST